MNTVAQDKSMDVIISRNFIFWKLKVLFDIIVCVLLLPFLIFLIFFIFILNFFYNRGPIFFIQKRMGADCKPFYAIKFRSMLSTDVIKRKFTDPLEVERITTLGRIIRKIRIDELPQILNVLKGDMSLIGPRPDYYEHAVEYLKNVKGYRERHIIRPGITGLSQIRLGYAEGLEATAKKVSVDNYYIQNVGYVIETKIIVNTIITIIRGMGK